MASIAANLVKFCSEFRTKLTDVFSPSSPKEMKWHPTDNNFYYFADFQNDILFFSYF